VVAITAITAYYNDYCWQASGDRKHEYRANIPDSGADVVPGSGGFGYINANSDSSSSGLPLVRVDNALKSATGGRARGPPNRFALGSSAHRQELDGTGRIGRSREFIAKPVALNIAPRSKLTLTRGFRLQADDGNSLIVGPGDHQLAVQQKRPPRVDGECRGAGLFHDWDSFQTNHGHVEQQMMPAV
jgi:hypothetical protein